MEKDQGQDEDLKKLFMTVLPVCQACITVGAKIPVRHAIRNAAQRAARVVVDDERRARRDDQMCADVQRPEREIETMTNTIPRQARESEWQRNTGTWYSGKGVDIWYLALDIVIRCVARY